jgi:hypothetical protein
VGVAQHSPDRARPRLVDAAHRGRVEQQGDVAQDGGRVGREI